MSVMATGMSLLPRLPPAEPAAGDLSILSTINLVLEIGICSPMRPAYNESARLIKIVDRSILNSENLELELELAGCYCPLVTSASAGLHALCEELGITKSHYID